MDAELASMIERAEVALSNVGLAHHQFLVCCNHSLWDEAESARLAILSYQEAYCDLWIAVARKVEHLNK